MSLYYLQKFLYELNRDEALQAKCREDIESCFDGFELTDEAVGLGPLEALLIDNSVTEIMVVDAATIYVETEQGIVPFELDHPPRPPVTNVIEPTFVDGLAPAARPP